MQEKEYEKEKCNDSREVFETIRLSLHFVTIAVWYLLAQHCLRVVEPDRVNRPSSGKVVHVAELPNVFCGIAYKAHASKGGVGGR